MEGSIKFDGIIPPDNENNQIESGSDFASANKHKFIKKKLKKEKVEINYKPDQGDSGEEYQEHTEGDYSNIQKGSVDRFFSAVFGDKARPESFYQDPVYQAMLQDYVKGMTYSDLYETYKLKKGSHFNENIKELFKSDIGNKDISKEDKESFNSIVSNEDVVDLFLKNLQESKKRNTKADVGNQSAEKRPFPADPAALLMTDILLQQPELAGKNLEQLDWEQVSEQFTKAVREVWQDFYYSGQWRFDQKTKEFELSDNKDMDAKVSLFLFKLAGIKGATLAKALPPGEASAAGTTFDSGKKDGVVVAKNKVVIDNHQPNRGYETSSAKIIYRLLASMGNIKENSRLRALVELSVDDDNGRLITNKKQFDNSNKTLRGLHRYLDADDLFSYIRSKWHNFDDVIKADESDRGRKVYEHILDGEIGGAEEAVKLLNISNTIMEDFRKINGRSLSYKSSEQDKNSLLAKYSIKDETVNQIKAATSCTDEDIKESWATISDFIKDKKVGDVIRLLNDKSSRLIKDRVLYTKLAGSDITKFQLCEGLDNQTNTIKRAHEWLLDEEKEKLIEEGKMVNTKYGLAVVHIDNKVNKKLYGGHDAVAADGRAKMYISYNPEQQSILINTLEHKMDMSVVFAEFIKKHPELVPVRGAFLIKPRDGQELSFDIGELMGKLGVKLDNYKGQILAEVNKENEYKKLENVLNTHLTKVLELATKTQNKLDNLDKV